MAWRGMDLRRVGRSARACALRAQAVERMARKKRDSGGEPGVHGAVHIAHLLLCQLLLGVLPRGQLRHRDADTHGGVHMAARHDAHQQLDGVRHPCNCRSDDDSLHQKQKARYKAGGVLSACQSQQRMGDGAVLRRHRAHARACLHGRDSVYLRTVLSLRRRCKMRRRLLYMTGIKRQCLSYAYTGDESEAQYKAQAAYCGHRASAGSRRACRVSYKGRHEAVRDYGEAAARAAAMALSRCMDGAVYSYGRRVVSYLDGACVRGAQRTCADGVRPAACCEFPVAGAVLYAWAVLRVVPVAHCAVGDDTGMHCAVSLYFQNRGEAHAPVPYMDGLCRVSEPRHMAAQSII